MNAAFRSAAAVFVALLLVTGIPARASAAPLAASAASASASAVDLSADLAQDGTFTGTAGASGTVDMSKWALVSDLAAGEAPRFAPKGSQANAIHEGKSPNPFGAPTPDGTAWQPLGSNAGDGAINDLVRTIAVIGSTVYVGGEFKNAAGIGTADYIAKWNGSSWSGLGSNGLGDGAINSSVFEIGLNGNLVYVGGTFINAGGVATADYVAYWNQTTWNAMGSNGSGDGALNNFVWSVHMSGSDVYVGGAFTNAAGIGNADHIALFHVGSWSAIGASTVTGDVYTIAGSGSDLYVGGDFTNAGGMATADYLVHWNGSAWSALGSNGAGNGAFSNYVVALLISGSRLYVGGLFQNAAGIATADYIAVWDGKSWSGLGSNGAGDGALNNEVEDIELFRGEIVVVGLFQDVRGNPEADRMAKFSGSTWLPVGDVGTSDGVMSAYVDDIAVSGSAIYVGGDFSNAAGIATADHVAVATFPSPWQAIGANAADGPVNGDVKAIAVSRGSLYIGGSFTNAGGVAAADDIARWDGIAWRALGSNGSGNGALNNWVQSIAVSGSTVYVGGLFTNVAGDSGADYLAVFDGSNWSKLGSNGSNPAINGIPYALAVSGSDLYVGGNFTNAGGVAAADYVAHWNGSSWSALGSDGAGNGALTSFVSALAASGSDVYVGGSFTNAGGVATADFVAHWNGSAWSGLGSDGSGNGALNAQVQALRLAGSKLYVAGIFSNVAGIAAADAVAQWNGTSWSALGSNGAGNGAIVGGAGALFVLGNDVYVGGAFTNAAGLSDADAIARFDGSTWHEIVGQGLGDGAFGSFIVAGSVNALAVLGGEVVAGGRFTNAAGIPVADNLVAAVSAGPWFAAGSNGFGDGALNGTVNAIAVAGSDIYIGGDFTDVAGIPGADYLARWNGKRWSAVGPALNAQVTAVLLVGSDLYAGGLFTDAGGQGLADYIARWDGTNWHALGGSGSTAALNDVVGTLVVMGSNVVAGGSFVNANGNAAADFIALWNGSTWTNLGSVSGNGALNSYVTSLAVSGSNLYVGGDFINAGGQATADHVALWNGSAWSGLGGNGSGDGAVPGRVNTVALSGGHVYVGGFFNDVAGLAAADYIAEWNGSTWLALGNNGSGGGAMSDMVDSIVFSGTDLYAGGWFGLGSTDFLARWNGTSWAAVSAPAGGGSALNDFVSVLKVSGQNLLIGGAFQNADDITTADDFADFAPIATTPAPVFKPDARIRKGSNSLVGDNIYNSTGTNQTVSGKTAIGNTITFTVSIQNDGNAADRFKVAATGASAAKYQVTFLAGSTDITAAVIAGTYQTPNVNPSSAFAITARVKVLSGAVTGSSVSRLVTVSSVANPSAIDAVKFTGKRN
jgi:hypothetical protein